MEFFACCQSNYVKKAQMDRTRNTDENRIYNFGCLITKGNVTWMTYQQMGE